MSSSSSAPGPEAPTEENLIKEITELQKKHELFLTNGFLGGKNEELLKIYGVDGTPNLTKLIALLRAYMVDYALCHNHVPAHMLSMTAKLRFLEAVDSGSARLDDVKKKVEATIAKIGEEDMKKKPFDHIYQVFGLDSVAYRAAMLDSIVPSSESIDVLAAAREMTSASFDKAVELASQVRESTKTIEKLQLQVRDLQTQLAAQQKRAFNIEIQQTKFDKLREIMIKELKVLEQKEEEEKAAAASDTSKAAAKKGDASDEPDLPPVFLMHSAITNNT